MKHRSFILLLALLTGVSLWDSKECYSADIVPLLSSSWQQNLDTDQQMKPLVQLSNVNVIFASHQEPYESYRSLKTACGDGRKVLEDCYLPEVAIDGDACCNCDEASSLFDSPDRIFSPRKVTHKFIPMVWEDARDSVTLQNSLLFGVALGGAIIVRNTLDDNVRQYTANHPNRWGETSHAFGKLGEPQIQIPAMLLLYGYSNYSQNNRLHDMSVSLLSAYTITGLSTLTVKWIANTDRPSADWNDGEYGFPSYHTSSSFALAAVIDEYYGAKAGLPAYALAGVIGWSRIDERDHDLSDVLFGAAMGYLIGKAVARKHLIGDSNVRLMPYIHPTDGSTGLMVEIPY